MRKLIFGAFLLGTTALFPVPAHADPITGIIGGLITALGAPGVGGAVAGAFGGFSAGAFAAGYGLGGSLLGGLVSTALSVGVSALAAALRPGPPRPANPGEKLVNIRQPISYMEFCYGLVRKGGPVNFWQGLEGKRFYDVILAAHEIEGIQTHYADERDLTLDSNGFAQGVYIYEDRSRLQVVDYLGAPGQASPPLLEGNFSEWTDAHDMEGLAHAVVVAENVDAEDFSEVYPTGREPVYTALVKGKKVYDPRDEATRYTTNAALIIADWIVSPDGLNREVDWDQVALEADASDAIVIDRNGNEFPKWQLCGSYSGADDREATRAAMGIACDAFFYEDVDGVVGFNVGRFIEPTVTIGDDDILRIQYAEGQAGTDVVNAQSVQYTEAAIGYREAPTSPYVIEDATESYSEDSLNVFWAPHHNQGVRIAKRLLKVARSQYKASMTLKAHGIRPIGKRFFRLRHEEFGLDATFEVDKFTRNDDGLTFSVQAHSVEAPDFAFDALTEEPEPPKRTALEYSSDVPPTTGITAYIEPYAGSMAIYVAWDAPPRDSLLNQVRYRVHDPAGDWSQINVPSGQDFQRVLGLADGETYDIQVRTTTSTGRASEWLPNDGDEANPTLNVTVTLDTTAPLALDTFGASGGMGNAFLAVQAKNDGHLARVALYRVAKGATLDVDDDPVVELLMGANATVTYTDGDATTENLFANPDFDSDTVWSGGANWSIAGGVASHAAGSAANFYQPVTTEAGTYRLGFEITVVSGGEVRQRFLTPSIGNGTYRDAVGVFVETITTTETSENLGFGCSSDFDGSIDNAVCFEETATCAPQGEWDYYAVPLNRSGVAGPVAGPVTATII